MDRRKRNRRTKVAARKLAESIIGPDVWFMHGGGPTMRRKLNCGISHRTVILRLAMTRLKGLCPPITEPMAYTSPLSRYFGSGPTVPLGTASQTGSDPSSPTHGPSTAGRASSSPG